MLKTLSAAATGGNLDISHVYLGHIKMGDDRKILNHAEALPWEGVEPSVRETLRQHLYDAIEGNFGEANFPCTYVGEVLPVAKVASAEFDRTRNRPTVEVLESIRDLPDVQEGLLIELGNTLAYKVMAAGKINSHLVAILKFAIIPQLGGDPVPFVFATMVDLENQDLSVLDESSGGFIRQAIFNIVKRGKVAKAAVFPCLDDDGKEMADLMVYARSDSPAWFKAMEMTRRFSPQHEAKTLVKLIGEQAAGGEVPHDLFTQMGALLLPRASDGMLVYDVVNAVERAVGHGIDRLGFQARWETCFGDLNYQPRWSSLFGDGRDIEKPFKLKMETGDMQIGLPPVTMQDFRHVQVGKRTFILFEVMRPARIPVATDTDIKIKPVDMQALVEWMTGTGGLQQRLELAREAAATEEGVH